jgi:hypothetical protein
MVGTYVEAQILSDVVDLVVDLSLDIIDDVVKEADNTIRAVRARRVEKLLADARCVELRKESTFIPLLLKKLSGSSRLTVTMA